MFMLQLAYCSNHDPKLWATIFVGTDRNEHNGHIHVHE